MPFVSVIIPVYNAESYIRRCVDSILNQSFTDFELLLVNDGSKDNSLAICKEYAAIDNRVKIFDKENGGVASARQFGLNKAIGEYTIHADPDDWVEKDWLQELYNRAKETNADITVCDYYFDTEKSSTVFVQKPNEETRESFLDGMIHDKLLGALWNKLIRRDCLEKYSIDFVEGLNYCEDFLVCVKLLVNEDIKLAYTPKALYHYDQYSNNNSYTRRYNEKIHDYECRLLDILKDYLTEEQLNYRKYILAYNEFNNYTLSSKEFKQKYASTKDVLVNNAPVKLKPFLYLSSVGCYSVARSIYNVFQKLKNN